MKRMTLLLGSSAAVTTATFFYCRANAKSTSIQNNVIAPNVQVGFLHRMNKPTPLFIEGYEDWVMQSTNDFQLLQYGPKDWILMVAFLRIIGIRHCNLSDFYHNFHTGRSYIKNLAIDRQEPHPILTLSVETALASIIEFNLPKEIVHIKSLNTSIKFPLEHVRMTMIEDGNHMLDAGIVQQLYTQIASLTQADIPNFINQFVPKCSAEEKQFLTERIIEAQRFCKHYLEISNTNLTFK